MRLTHSLILARGLALLAAQTCGRPETEPPKPRPISITGTVVDATPDTSTETFDELAAAESEEEFVEVFEGIMVRRPAAKVAVTAQGELAMRKIAAVSQGNLAFIGLPEDVYALSAAMPWWSWTDDQGAYCLQGLDGMGRTSFQVNFHGPPGATGCRLSISNVPLTAINVNLTMPAECPDRR